MGFCHICAGIHSGLHFTESWTAVPTATLHSYVVTQILIMHTYSKLHPRSYIQTPNTDILLSKCSMCATWLYQAFCSHVAILVLVLFRYLVHICLHFASDKLFAHRLTFCLWLWSWFTFCICMPSWFNKHLKLHFCLPPNVPWQHIRNTCEKCVSPWKCWEKYEKNVSFFWCPFWEANFRYFVWF